MYLKFKATHLMLNFISVEARAPSVYLSIYDISLGGQVTAEVIVEARVYSLTARGGLSGGRKE